MRLLLSATIALLLHGTNPRYAPTLLSYADPAAPTMPARLRPAHGRASRRSHLQYRSTNQTLNPKP
eukprot:2386627-Rhodomonas_salina.2